MSNDVEKKDEFSFQNYLANHRADFVDKDGRPTVLLSIIICFIACKLAYDVFNALNSN